MIAEMKATRKSYGEALVALGAKEKNLMVLDAGTGNSTYADLFKARFPDRFLEMYIAEQNMAGVALGLSKRGKVPFISTFAAFLTRAHDQIRMAALAQGNIKIAGSHAGVSIGQDGASQMGLEDIALFRSLPGAIVFYPSDAISTAKLTEIALYHQGLVYLRLTRAEVPTIYSSKEEFKVGGSKTIKESAKDEATIVTAGITLFEAINAAEEMAKKGKNVRVIDLYSIKPLDTETLLKAAKETGHILTVEDHYPEGGLGEAVSVVVQNSGAKFASLAVRKIPQSGTPQELLEYEEIGQKAILQALNNWL